MGANATVPRAHAGATRATARSSDGVAAVYRKGELIFADRSLTGYGEVTLTLFFFVPDDPGRLEEPTRDEGEISQLPAWDGCSPLRTS